MKHLKYILTIALFLILALPMQASGHQEEGKVESAKFPGASGAFMVLPRHAPIISALTAGKIVCTQQGEPKEITIQGGFVEISKDVISACVEV